jgi:hypothetical protein
MAFFAIQDKATLKIVSYCSDDSPGFAGLAATHNVLGPFINQQAAQQANEPLLPTPQQSTLQTLNAKPSATWTLADVADWLKSR